MFTGLNFLLGTHHSTQRVSSSRVLQASMAGLQAQVVLMKLSPQDLCSVITQLESFFIAKCDLTTTKRFMAK